MVTINNDLTRNRLIGNNFPSKRRFSSGNNINSLKLNNKNSVEPLRDDISFKGFSFFKDPSRYIPLETKIMSVNQITKEIKNVGVPPEIEELLGRIEQKLGNKEIILERSPKESFKLTMIRPFTAARRMFKKTNLEQQEKDKMETKLKGFHAISEDIKYRVKGSSKKEELAKAFDYAIDNKNKGNHAKISGEFLQFGNRMVSGIISAIFVSVDFANIKEITSGNKKEADKEFKSKFEQDILRVTMCGVAGYFASSMLSKLTNKSLKAAVGLNAAIIVLTDILSRLATGRPVLPQFGKVEKNKDKKEKQSIDQDNDANIEGKSKKAEKNKSDYWLWAALLGSIVTLPLIAKKGFGNFGKMFSHKVPKNDLISYFKALPESEVRNVAKAIRSFLNKVKRNKKYSPILKMNITDKTTKSEIINAFKEVKLKDIQIDQRHIRKIWERVRDGLVWPIKAIGNLSLIPEKLQCFISKKLTPKNEKFVDFKAEPVKYNSQYVKNAFDNVDKILKEKKGSYTLSNIHTWDGFEQRYLDKKTDIINPNFASYSGDNVGTLFKLTGMFSVPFLSIDALNVSNASGESEEVSRQKCKDRAIQDTSRQGVSFWINKMFNHALKEFCNFSILTNAIVVATNVALYESATRLAVGVPITRKSKEEIEELDEKNYNKKGISGTLFRAFSKITGKKPLSEKAVEADKNNKKQLDAPPPYDYESSPPAYETLPTSYENAKHQTPNREIFASWVNG